MLINTCLSGNSICFVAVLTVQTLKMERTIPSEKKLVIICQSIRRHISEYLNWIFIITDVTASNLPNKDLLFLNPSTGINEGPNFDRKCRNSKFTCCGTTLMIGCPLLKIKEPKHMGKRFGGSEETRDPRRCIMHIVFQEVERNIFESRDRALEPSPVWTDSFGKQMLLTPNKILLQRHACFTKLPWKLLLNATVCEVALAFLILPIQAFHDFGLFIDVQMN
jgi:hypothetical protein